MGGGEVIKKGWLIKSPPLEGGGMKAWRKRFFKLRSSKVLEYYKGSDGDLQKGVINLEDCKSVHSDLSHKKYKNVFDVETKDRIYYLVAQSQEEMKEWVDVLCRICGLTVQDIPEFLPTVDTNMSIDVSRPPNTGPTISSPVYATAATSGVPLSERFKPSEEAIVESTYSLACSVETEVQRQLNVEQVVPAGTPLAEALASKGLGSGPQTSSAFVRSPSLSSAGGSSASGSSASGREASAGVDSPLFLSPHHEPTSTDSQNFYSPVPKKNGGGLVRPVPKPRAATLNPPRTAEYPNSTSQQLTSSLAISDSFTAGSLSSPARGERAEMMENGYLKPRQVNNYDQVPPGPPRPAIQQAIPPSKQHRSALLREGTSLQEDVAPNFSSSGKNPNAYVNVQWQKTEDHPPVVNRSIKPVMPSPPRVDRKLKPKTHSETSFDHSDSDNSPPAPVFPERTTSLANTNNFQADSESPPNFPVRTTSLANSLESSLASFSEEMGFSERDLPRPSPRTTQYTQVEFDENTGKPAFTDYGSIPPEKDQDTRKNPIPIPRTGIGRVNYSNIDLAATKSRAESNSGVKKQVTLGEAEIQALKEKPYVNVNREGTVDEASDPGYYTHMRNLTFEEALEVYSTALNADSDEEDSEEHFS